MKKNEAIIFCDGACRGNPGPSSVGYCILQHECLSEKIGRKMDPIFENLPVLARGAQKIGIATNNIAEYKALIFALEKAISLSLTHVQVYMDSQLVIRQMRREYKVKNASLKILYRKANLLEAKFIQCLFLEIPRTKNSFADKLANNALDS